MARSQAYWRSRQKKQLGRFGGKAVKAVTEPSVASVAKAAWSGVKYLRTLVNSESFKKDTAVSGNVTTPSITHLTAIGQDDTVSGRTGNSILVNSVSGRVSLSANATAVSNIVRVLLVVDRQQVADSSPAIGDILNTNNDVYAHYNVNTLGRFKVLYDKIFTVNTAGKNAVFFKFFKTINDHTKYNGTASSDVQRNGIYVVVVSDNGTNGPALASSFRVSYRDN